MTVPAPSTSPTHIRLITSTPKASSVRLLPGQYTRSIMASKEGSVQLLKSSALVALAHEDGQKQ
jgi:hypothetical protein